MPFNRSKPIAFLFAAAFFGLGAILSEWWLQSSDRDLANKASLALTKLEAEMRPFLSHQTLPSPAQWGEMGIAGNSYSATGELMAWTTNEVPFDPLVELRAPLGISVLKLRGGYYLRMVGADSLGRSVLYGLIRKDLPFNNKFIVDRWGPLFPFDGAIKVSISGSQGQSVLLNGMPVLRIWHDATMVQKPHLVVVALWVLTFIFLVFALVAWDRQGSLVPTGLGHWVVPFLLVGLRAVLHIAQWPQAIYSLPLFSPDLYAASSLVPSFGDLILHVALAVYLAHRVAASPYQLSSGPGKAIVGIVVYLLSGKLIYLLIDSLVNDSTIALDLNNPTGLDQWSILAFATIALAVWAWLKLAQWWVGAFRPSWVAYPVLTVVFGLGFISTEAYGNVGLLPFTIILVAIAGYLTCAEELDKRVPKHFRSLPLVVLFAALVNAALVPAIKKSDQELRQTLARRTLLDHDPVAEHLFPELRNSLVNDRNIRNCLAVSPARDEELLDEIRSKFTYGHWQRYTVGISLYDRNGGLLVTDQGLAGPNFHEAKDQVSRSAPTVSEGLFFKGGWDAAGGYMAMLNFESRRENSGGQTLVITLNPIRLIRSTGLDEVLLDDAFGTDIGLGRYSVARYIGGTLVESRGDYPYALSARSHKSESVGEALAEGVEHTVFSDEANTQVWVTGKHLGLLAWFTCFSYLLFFGLALIGLTSLISNWRRGTTKWGFRSKITLAISGMLALSLILVGGLTGYFVSDQFDMRNREALTEKAGSVLIELESKLKDHQALSKGDADILGRLLAKFSSIFLSDLTLYNPQGQMLATSRPRLVEAGISAPVMDPRAFAEMSVHGHSSYVQSERLGSLNYLAAYVPLRNHKGQTIAFLGLPYFGRQYSLNRETSTLLAALADLFTILILISVVVAVILADRITGPLAILQRHMEKLSLDGRDSLIEWKGNDEVGELVKAYNRAVVDLMHSAELLAKREREDAWREMARQVAHEIKNPLTPMRLSIQMLERSQRDGAPDMPERVAKVSRTLIEQIDALARIATEFSEFAQMPGPKLTEVDLRTVLSNLQNLFDGSPEFDFDVNLDANVPSPARVKADRDQLIRVFNNLVRNAIQSIPAERKGTVKVSLHHEPKWYTISIQDNGIGMTEEVQAKAFVPNFSTKSSGMGLGLAMVKGMVEGMGGEVSFTSQVNVGTNFVVKLPAL